MEKLMHKIISDDIHFFELKLRRISLSKSYLLETKTYFFQMKELKKWNLKFNELIKEEERILSDLKNAYTELESGLFN